MKKIYYLFFPKNRILPFSKLRWIIMVIIQEIMMGKYKAVFKYFIKPSYRKDINLLCDLLSKGRLTGRKDMVKLSDINYSHEINYPKWVHKLQQDLWKDIDNYKRIKVILHNNKYLIVDGNHRLQAFNRTFAKDRMIKVLILEYVNEQILKVV
jgi:hypothetical protein